MDPKTSRDRSSTLANPRTTGLFENIRKHANTGISASQPCLAASAAAPIRPIVETHSYCEEGDPFDTGKENLSLTANIVRKTARRQRRDHEFIDILQSLITEKENRIHHLEYLALRRHGRSKEEMKLVELYKQSNQAYDELRSQIVSQAGQIENLRNQNKQYRMEIDEMEAKMEDLKIKVKASEEKNRWQAEAIQTRDKKIAELQFSKSKNKTLPSDLNACTLGRSNSAHNIVFSNECSPLHSTPRQSPRKLDIIWPPK